MEKRKKEKRKKKNTKFSFFDVFKDNENTFTLFEVTIIILISVIFGCIIGYLLTYSNSSLSVIRTDPNLGEVVSTYRNIVDNYYEDLDEKELAQSAIKGMIASLDDPYSTYLDEGDTDTFNESVDGEYIGIGVTIQFQEEYNVIYSVLEGGPADKAGVQVGDIILSINGEDCHNLYPGELNSFIVGDVGTFLTMKVKRGEEELSFRIARQMIEIENVSSKIYEEDQQVIGYLQLKMFSSNSYDQFEEKLLKLEKKNISSLIIDLRDNPGGHLSQAKKILDLFFPKKTVLYQTESNGKKKKVVATTKEKRTYPVVLLINGDTASSAEVVASCFQENYKKVHIIGLNSYGKGNVQKSLTLSGGTSIKFTIERWLTSKGKSVSEVGVTPDILLGQNPVYYNTNLEEDDTQLQKAISTLKES